MIDDKSQIEDIFSESWRQVQAGRSIEYVLADYPEYAAQLEPTLRLAVRLRALSTLQPSPDSFSRIQQRTRSALGGHYSVTAEIAEPGKASEPPQRSQAQTGDEKVAPLYRRWLTPLLATVRVSGAALVLLVMVAAGAIVLDVMKIGSDTDTPRAVVAYSGTITNIEGSVWHVDETEILIDDATQMHGQPSVGTTMHCIGEQLGSNEMRAFEVWVGTAPGAPTSTPDSR